MNRRTRTPRTTLGKAPCRSYEYSKWDGSQQFQPQSAEKAFDELTEYLLHYGDQVLRQLDRDDDDDDPEIVELLQQEGLLERDGRGSSSSRPRGSGGSSRAP